MLKIVRRLGLGPIELGATSGRESCPDLFELVTGDFAVIGTDVTETLRGQLPDDASCGEDERIVVVKRVVLISAKNDIPNK